MSARFNLPEPYRLSLATNDVERGFLLRRLSDISS